MTDYGYCEIVRGYSRWHIRRMKKNSGQQTGAKPDSNTLCGIPAVRDIHVIISPFYLSSNTCSICVQIYLDLVTQVGAKTDDDGKG